MPDKVPWSREFRRMNMARRSYQHDDCTISLADGEDGRFGSRVRCARCRDVRTMRSGFLLCLLLSSRVFAAGSNPVPEPQEAAPAVKTADAAYNAGLSARAAGKWQEAEASFGEATELKPDSPEAWSELGHARKKRGLYDDSVKAYQEALRLRPDFPQAMEYLGETYVRMGKRTEAQALLDRLRPLDAKLAGQLEAAMKGESASY